MASWMLPHEKGGEVKVYEKPGCRRPGGPAAVCLGFASLSVLTMKSAQRWMWLQRISVTGVKQDEETILGWEMSVREPNHTRDIFIIHLTQHVGGSRVVRGVPNIVKSTMEAWCIIGQWEFSDRRVGALEVELVAHSFRGEFAIVLAHEVWMVGRDKAFVHILVHPRIGDRVKVTAYDERYLRALAIRDQLRPVRRFPGWELGKLIGNALQFLHEDTNLNELDIPEIRVPVNMQIRDDEPCTCGPLLEEGNDGNVIPLEDTVEHVVRLIKILSLDRNRAELDDLVLDEQVLLYLVEGRAAIRLPLLVLWHRLCSALGRPIAVPPVFVKAGREELFVLDL